MSCNYIPRSPAKSSVSILILDACRNNPYAGQGRWAVVLPPWKEKPEVQYIIYSHAAGLEADDGTETTALFRRAKKIQRVTKLNW
jgi:hypothetical protein